MDIEIIYLRRNVIITIMCQFDWTTWYLYIWLIISDVFVKMFVEINIGINKKSKADCS
jgi:hypothetical protein